MRQRPILAAGEPLPAPHPEGTPTLLPCSVGNHLVNEPVDVLRPPDGTRRTACAAHRAGA